MEIDSKIGRVQLPQLRTLKPGTVFGMKERANLSMRRITDEWTWFMVLAPYPNDPFDPRVSVVRLDNGLRTYIPSHAQVHPTKAKLSVEVIDG